MLLTRFLITVLNNQHRATMAERLKPSCI